MKIRKSIEKLVRDPVLEVYDFLSGRVSVRRNLQYRRNLEEIGNFDPNSDYREAFGKLKNFQSMLSLGTILLAFSSFKKELGPLEEATLYSLVGMKGTIYLHGKCLLHKLGTKFKVDKRYFLKTKYTTVNLGAGSIRGEKVSWKEMWDIFIEGDDDLCEKDLDRRILFTTKRGEDYFRKWSPKILGQQD